MTKKAIYRQKDGCYKVNSIEEGKANIFNSILILSNLWSEIFKCFKFILTDWL